MKKFSIEELEKIFIESEVKTLAELTEDFEKNVEKKDVTTSLVFSLHNTLAMSKLKDTFFKELESKD